MALRFSKGLRNFLNEGGPIKQALANGKLLIYTGSQPTTADDAVAGTLPVTITKSSGAHTAEVRATGSVTLTGGASGSVNTVTVNSVDILGAAVNFNASLTQTATDVATQINNNPKNLLFVAEASGAVITLKAKPGLGTLCNGWVVTATLTTITATYVNIGSGVAGVNAANGLTFGDSAAGILARNTVEVWSGTAVADGTAGWFRYVGSVADAGSSDATETYIRLDGNIATSGANLNMSNTAIVTGAVQTISGFSLTYPAA
jgi:hypothetical protein